MNIEVHHIRNLVRRYKGNIVTVAINKKKRSGTSGAQMASALNSALKMKQIPLCQAHHVQMHAGNINPSDIEDANVHPKTIFLGGPNKG